MLLSILLFLLQPTPIPTPTPEPVVRHFIVDKHATAPKSFTTDSMIATDITALDRFQFQSGDTIEVKSGTYTTAGFWLSGAGSATQPITLTFDKYTYLKGSGTAALISMGAGTDYWTIDGLHAKSATNSRIFDVYKASHNVLRNCTLGPVPNNGCVVLLSNATGWTIDHCTITAWAGGLLTSPVGVTSEGLWCDSCDGCIIQNSTFNDAGHIALSLNNSPGNIVSVCTICNHLHTGIGIGDLPNIASHSTNNVVQHCTIKHYNERPSWPDIPGIGIELTNSSGNTVQYCVIRDGRNGATGIALGCDPTKGVSANQTIRNNTIYKPGGRGIELANFGADIGDKNGITGNIIERNIITGIGAPAAGDNQASRNAPICITASNWPERDGYGNVLTGNVIYVPNGIGMKLRENDCILRQNYPVTLLNGWKWADGNVNVNPGFVLAGSNFNLRSTSPVPECGAYPLVKITE